MRFSTRHLMYLTLLVAVHFAHRGWWLALRIPVFAGMIPAAVAILVGGYIGWSRRPVLHAGLFAGVAALISATQIAAEVVFRLSSTTFLTTAYSKPVPNLLALIFVTAVSALVGSLSALVLRGIRNSLEHRNYFRVTWIVCVVVGVSTLMVGQAAFPRISAENAKKISLDMHQRDVVALLGRSNYPPPSFRTKSEEMWDDYTHQGRHYVSIHVWFDSNGRVVDVRKYVVWQVRWWLYW